MGLQAGVGWYVLVGGAGGTRVAGSGADVAAGGATTHTSHFRNRRAA